ncbi:putative transmembrane protein [Vespula maculifrons]|uniref:Transmembrane protein n=1 Tax=Vespula maculifrons TaxID=7453 RepID=A0ABD2CBG0_VESMC
MCFFLLFVPPFLLFRCFFPLFFFLLFSFISADDRVHFNDEQEKRWNTPPELTPEQVSRKKPETINGRAEARFLPFSASFSLNAGQDNSKALQLGAGLGGISVSQSSSFSQAEANSFGNTGSSLSSSQSSSFAAGLTGISASDANSFNVNHPVFGGQSNANSNSFSVGQASASSQANAQNGQASSGSQASIGSVHSSASSGSNVQALSDGLIIGQPQGPRKPVWTNIGPNHDFPGHPISNRPTLTIQEAPITTQQKRPITLTLGGYNPRWQQGRPQLQVNEWHPNGEVNFQGHQWRPHSKHEYAQGYPSIPNSWLQGQGQSNGGLHITVASADSSASSNSGVYTQGQATSVHRNPYRRTERNFANVNSMRENDPSVDFVKFPGQTNVQSIPREFVRSKQMFDGKHRREEKDFVESIVSDITDTVSDLLDIS